MFWAVQDTPSHNDRKDNVDTYACQLIVSWPYRAGFLGRSEPIEIPASQEERLSLMKEIAKSWASPFRDAVFAIPADTHIQAVNLESWKPAPGKWDSLNGRATLIGDAAHTMYASQTIPNVHRASMLTNPQDYVPRRGLQPRHPRRRAIRLQPHLHPDRRERHIWLRGSGFFVRKCHDRAHENRGRCE